MPTKPMGPPTETAAPVASDAAKNATRCARSTFTPRVAGGLGADAQQVQRPRQPGERRKRDARRAAAPRQIGA